MTRSLTLIQRQDFAQPPSKLFPFFSDARNLEVITPPWLRFEVLTPDPIRMKPGALIDYRLKWHGIPLRWQTEILEWEPPYRFVDSQRRGPYRSWVHEHKLEDYLGGTRMSDTVRYVAWGGIWLTRLFVSTDVARVFAYRRSRLESLLSRGQGDG